MISCKLHRAVLHNMTDKLYLVVAGLKFRLEDYQKAQVKPGDLLNLVWQPDNKFDNNAVAVFKGVHHIGFVPRNETAWFHNYRRCNAKFDVKVRVASHNLCAADAVVQVEEGPHSKFNCEGYTP